MNQVHREVVRRAPAGQQVHASTLLVDGGTTWMAWFEGTREGAADNRIMLVRGNSGQFDQPQAFGAEIAVAHWNPVLAKGLDGRYWLFFKRGSRIDEWRTYCVQSDDGIHWSTATELVPGDDSGGRGPVRQAPLRRGDLWLAPGSVESWHPPRWDCFIDLSADKGASWQQLWLPLDHETTRGAGCIQPALVQVPDGSLVALARSTAGSVYRACSADGYVWTPLEPTSLPNNNSGIACVVLPDGRIACVHNPASGDWGPRDRLIVSTSVDAGLHWETQVVLEDGRPLPGLPQGRPGDGAPMGASQEGVMTDGIGEYSYPSATVHDGELWVSYTWQRRAIVLARCPLSALGGQG